MPHEAIASREDLARFLRKDLEAHRINRWRWTHRLSRPQLHYQRLLRFTEYWKSVNGFFGSLMFVIYRVRLARLSQRLGLSIPPGVFGPGLCVPHYGSVVVNDKARFGSNCKIHSGVNVGEYKGFAPSGGDDIYFGPGAVIYGDTRLGNRVIIGANSVVFGEFGNDITLVGAPARQIANNSA